MKNKYIDIHTHILPNVDDGAQSMVESMQMLHMAYDEGIRTIIATPHYGMEQFSSKPEKCANLINILNYGISIDKTLSGMKVLLGNELLYRADISQEIKNGLANTIAGTEYVLIEFYVDAAFSTLEACAKEMKMAGYKPIFAHIERYFCLMDDMSKLDKLKELDVLLQVNSMELAEPLKKEEQQKNKKSLFRREQFDFSEERKKLAWKYIFSGKVDFIASDMHNTEWRRPVMKTALENIREAGGSEIVDKIIENTEKILENK